MSERTLLLQTVTTQRAERPSGLRIWSDGLVQRSAEDNPFPGPTERLDLDRELNWRDEHRLTPDQVGVIRDAIGEIGFFELPPRLLINYCKDDPGTTIWTVTVGRRTGHVVVYDPRPKRSLALDRLSALVNRVLAGQF
jgi:hypothetical protein